MRTMKYLVTEKGPLVFPSEIRHSTMKHLKPVSGAFITIVPNMAFVSGSAEFLGLKADAEILSDWLGLDVTFVEFQ